METKSAALSNATLARVALSCDQLIQNLVDNLFYTDHLAPVHIAAVQDPQIETQAYQSFCAQSIMALGEAIAMECTEPQSADPARLLQSDRISSRIVRDIRLRIADLDERIEHRERVAAAQQDDHDSGIDLPTHPDAEIQCERFVVAQVRSMPCADQLRDRAELQAFLERVLSSEAYRKFILQLKDFAQSPYHARLVAALGSIVISSSGHRLNEAEIKVQARDISWAPVQNISISTRAPCSIGDTIKGTIEAFVGDEILWMPFRQRRHPLAQGFARLSWLSVSGSRQIQSTN